MPTGPITYGLKFCSVLFAKLRKGGRAVVVKTGKNKFHFSAIGSFWSCQCRCGALRKRSNYWPWGKDVASGGSHCLVTRR